MLIRFVSDSERFYGSPLAGLSLDICVHTKTPTHSTAQSVSADTSQHKFEVWGCVISNFSVGLCLSMFLCLCASVYVYICVAKGNVQILCLSMCLCLCAPVYVYICVAKCMYIYIYILYIYIDISKSCICQWSCL